MIFERVAWVIEASPSIVYLRYQTPDELAAARARARRDRLTIGEHELEPEVHLWTFDKDINAATQFSREVDAIETMRILALRPRGPLIKDWLRPVEHMWPITIAEFDEQLRLATREAMADAWNEICADSEHHPRDLSHGRGTRLEFEPSTWADLTALRLGSLLRAEPAKHSASAGADVKDDGVQRED